MVKKRAGIYKINYAGVSLPLKFTDDKPDDKMKRLNEHIHNLYTGVYISPHRFYMQMNTLIRLLVVGLNTSVHSKNL